MTEEQKRKLKLAEAKKGISSNVAVIPIPEELRNTYEKLVEAHDTITRLLDNHYTSEKIDKQVDKLTQVNNQLVSLISILEKSTGSREIVHALTKLLNKEPIKLPDKVSIDNPTEFPSWLKTDKAFSELTKSLEKGLRNISEQVKATPQGQRPEDFVPFRRVRKVGNRLEFDDSAWRSGGGGGGGSSSGGTFVIADEGGEKVTVTGGKLDVNATVSGSGDGNIQDGVDPNIKATVRAATSDATKYGLVVLNPDGSDQSSVQIKGIDTNGVVRTAVTDTAGRLKLSQGQPAPTTGSITASAQTVFASMDGFANAYIYLTGTFSAFNGTFEQSPDSTDGSDGVWYTVQSQNISTGAISTTTGSISAQASYVLNVGGAAYVRIRSTALTSGTVSVSIVTTTAATQPGVSIATTPTVNLSGTGTLVDNAAFTDGSTRVVVGGYIFDEVAGTALTENDAGAARMDSKRAQVMVFEDATTRGRRATVSAGGALLTDSSATTQPVSGTITASNTAGDVANDGVDSGNPVKIGGVARTALPTAVADADRVNATFDKFGRQVVLVDGFRDIDGDQLTTISASTTETTVATAVASTFLDLTSVLVSNTSGTAVRVDFRDTTGGSVRFPIYIPAGDTRGIVFHRPRVQTTVNTNWTAQCSASVTDVRISVGYIKNK